jgi:hypothetical protein
VRAGTVVREQPVVRLTPGCGSPFYVSMAPSYQL